MGQIPRVIPFRVSVFLSFMTVQEGKVVLDPSQARQNHFWKVKVHGLLGLESVGDMRVGFG